MSQANKIEQLKKESEDYLIQADYELKHEIKNGSKEYWIIIGKIISTRKMINDLEELLK